MKRKQITVEPTDLFNFTGEYFTVEAWMLHLGFTDAQVLVYAHIRNLNKRGISGLSLTRIANVLNKSKSTISESVKALEKRGLLCVTVRNLPNGAQASSLFETIEPELVEIRGILIPTTVKKTPFGGSNGGFDAATPGGSVYRTGGSTGRTGGFDIPNGTRSTGRTDGVRQTEPFNKKEKKGTYAIPVAPTSGLRSLVTALSERDGHFTDELDRRVAGGMLGRLSSEDWTWLQTYLPTEWFTHCVDLAPASPLPSPKQAAVAAKVGGSAGASRVGTESKTGTNRGVRKAPAKNGSSR